MSHSSVRRLSPFSQIAPESPQKRRMTGFSNFAAGVRNRLFTLGATRAARSPVRRPRIRALCQPAGGTQGYGAGHFPHREGLSDCGFRSNRPGTH